MNVKSLLAGFALLVLFSATAGAAVLSMDWKTPGDGLLTYDTVSGREWLDISQSRLSLFSDLSVTDEAIAAAKLELLPGGALEGFTLASRADVFGLVISAGVDVSTIDQAEQTADQMRALVRLLGDEKNGGQPTQGAEIIAVIDELMTPPPLPLSANANVAAILAVSPANQSRPHGIASLAFAPKHDRYRAQAFPQDTVSLALYRASVPEPASLAVAMLLITCFLVTYSGKQLQTRNPRCWPRINVSRLAVECCTTPVDFARRWGAE